MCECNNSKGLLKSKSLTSILATIENVSPLKFLIFFEFQKSDFRCFGKPKDQMLSYRV